MENISLDEMKDARKAARKTLRKIMLRETLHDPRISHAELKDIGSALCQLMIPFHTKTVWDMTAGYVAKEVLNYRLAYRKF